MWLSSPDEVIYIQVGAVAKPLMVSPQQLHTTKVKAGMPLMCAREAFEAIVGTGLQSCARCCVFVSHRLRCALYMLFLQQYDNELGTKVVF